MFDLIFRRHNGPILIALVCFLTNHSCTGVELAIPKLKLNFVASEKVLNAGSNFTLICEGNRPVHWEILSSQDELPDTSTTQEEYAEYGYSVKLHLRSVDVTYVGSYICRFNSSDKSETDIQKSVYIYVKDPVKPLASTDSFIIGNQYKNLTIPCKPSAPDVQVTLSVDDVPIVPGQPFAELEDRIVTYDPQIGYTIPDTQMQDSSHEFSCRGVLQEVEDTRVFKTSIMFHIDSLPKPQITDAFSCDGTTVIHCKVHILWGIHFLIRWVHPKKVSMDQERISVKNWQDTKETNDNFKVARSTLTIFNTTNEDMGLYKCEIIDPNDHINSDEIFVSEDCKQIENIMAGTSDILMCKDTLYILIIFLLLLIILAMFCSLMKRSFDEKSSKSNLPLYVSKNGFESLKT